MTSQAREARENPLVSVVLTTYSRPDLLKKAISSVLKQSLENFELIIVDDFSPNRAENLKLAKSFNDDRIHYICTDHNYGHDSHPKNLGIKEAKGEYITFLDDDDSYRVDALKILSIYMKESDADIVYGDYLIGEKDGKKHPGWSMDFSPSTLNRMNYIAMCVVMVKRSALLKVGGFDEDVPKFKDWNLWIRLQKSGHRFLHVAIIVAEVSSQEESVSTKYKVDYDESGRYLPTFFNPSDCLIYPKNTCLGEKKSLRVAIYTMTMNRLELTKVMAESLKTAAYPFDWFVVDQGSSDGTVDWLKTQNCKVEYNEKNVGLEIGWNQCIDFIRKTGEYDIIIKIDNDAQMLTQGWLKAMIDLFERNSTLILSPYVEGLENTPGGVMRQRITSDNLYVLINDMVLGNVPNLGGIVFAHHIDLVKDWKFPVSFEGNKDYLLSQYAKALGYSLFYMEEFRVWHQLGTEGQKKKYPEYFAKK